MNDMVFNRLIFTILVSFGTLLCSCGDTEHTIKMKGSDTEVNLAVNLAEAYNGSDPTFSMAISGGGSGLGITSLLNGQADIANSSRPLTEDEEALFKKKNIRLKTVVFAEDATAFVTHSDNPISEIDVKTLSKIMSGQVENWKSISGQDIPITIYGRQSSSGTYSFIRKKLKIVYSQKAKEMTGNAQILEAIKIDKSGIGYVGAGYISKKIQDNKGIKVLKIKNEGDSNAISPLDPTAIKKRLYFFQRPLYQFIPEKSWDKVLSFIHFETKGEGTKIIENSGYYLIH
ncbi:PstS family phosphate ABC transporter substrate-binding protein [Sphingobacterium prati]|uniref:PstS family phosphate ABC transporter substrate-binding protein n=1 Tax=Sphingobacterium prati TaxID=2737006 RepID=UPI001FEC0461|nr:PstS family phosphate ABC transporter substrate-binding protein [Sphingobacterium prati]